MVAPHGRNGRALTPRELEVLTRLQHGKSTSEIALLLAIRERTVKFHISNIVHKLHAKNRVHALAIAIERQLVAVTKQINTQDPLRFTR